MLSGLLRESLPEHAMVPGGPELSGWPTLLVVDHDVEMLQTLICYFEKRGFKVAAARTFSEAKTHFHRRKSWSLVVADYHLPDATGRDLASWVQAQSQTVPVLLMSGSPQSATLCAGADYLAKPFRLETLEKQVRVLLGRH
jgi:DNA-binding response OmpR family regulator